VFCSALFCNTALELFECQHNPLRDEGAVAFAHVLNAWTAIRQLDLELSEIGDAGTKWLCNGPGVADSAPRSSGSPG
jgi:Ran GTPase-activating protein (RanGAP) involved in mRNA processing and transport